MRKLIKSLFAVLLIVFSSAISQPAAAQGPATRIVFPRGADTVVRTGVLRFGGADRYVIRLLANQRFTVVADAGQNNNVILIIWGRDGTVLISDHADANAWSGATPKEQDYFIDVRAIDGTTANYSLRVTADPLTPAPPDPSIKRIVFAPGTISATVAGTATPARQNEYVIKANAGQRMLISVAAGAQPAGISVVGADGTVLLSRMPGASNFSGTLPSTQDYFIKVFAEGAGSTTYRMTVTIEPL